MNKEASKDQMPTSDDEAIETVVDTKIESEQEDNQLLTLGRERVGLVNVRHNPKKGNKNDRY